MLKAWPERQQCFSPTPIRAWRRRSLRFTLQRVRLLAVPRRVRQLCGCVSQHPSLRRGLQPLRQQVRNAQGGVAENARSEHTFSVSCHTVSCRPTRRGSAKPLGTSCSRSVPPTCSRDTGLPHSTDARFAKSVARQLRPPSARGFGSPSTLTTNPAPLSALVFRVFTAAMRPGAHHCARPCLAGPT